MDKYYYLIQDSCIKMLPVPDPLLKFRAEINPYAGCPGSCIFCPESYLKRTGVRTNIPHLLEKELSFETSRLHIGLGTECEPYCSAEKKYNITRHSIEICAKYGAVLQIFTKSSLILRDISLLKVLSEKGRLAVSVSLFTADKKLARLFEPLVASPGERFGLVSELNERGVFSGIVLGPILPSVSDSEEILEEVFINAKKADAKYVIPRVLSAGNDILQKNIFKLIQENFPESGRNIRLIYENYEVIPRAYFDRLWDLLQTLSQKYSLPLSIPVHGESDVSQNVVKV
jgi:DNA repair photolyase